MHVNACRYTTAILAMLAQCCREAVAEMVMPVEPQPTPMAADANNLTTSDQKAVTDTPVISLSKDAAAQGELDGISSDLEPPVWKPPDDSFVLPGFGRIDAKRLMELSPPKPPSITVKPGEKGAFREGSRSRSPREADRERNRSNRRDDAARASGEEDRDRSDWSGQGRRGGGGALKGDDVGAAGTWSGGADEAMEVDEDVGAAGHAEDQGKQAVVGVTDARADVIVSDRKGERVPADGGVERQQGAGCHVWACVCERRTVGAGFGEKRPPLPEQRPLPISPAVAHHMDPLPQLLCAALLVPQAPATLALSSRFLQNLALQEAMDVFESGTETLIGKVQQGVIEFSDADEGILKVAKALGDVCECLEVLCAPRPRAWWLEEPQFLLTQLPEVPLGDAAALQCVARRGILLRCMQMVCLPPMIVNAIVESGIDLDTRERQSLERRLGTHLHSPLRVRSPLHHYSPVTILEALHTFYFSVERFSRLNEPLTLVWQPPVASWQPWCLHLLLAVACVNDNKRKNK
jgi:hypothetical protein